MGRRNGNKSYENFEQQLMCQPSIEKTISQDVKAAQQKFWADLCLVAQKPDIQRLKDVALQKPEDNFEKDGFKLLRRAAEDFCEYGR
jgi:hypothetical protein